MKQKLRVGPERDDPSEVSAEQLRAGRSMEETYPGFSQATVRRGRGKGLKAAKVMVSLRLEANLIDAYKATGKGWQGRMRDAIAMLAPHQDGTPAIAIDEKSANILKGAVRRFEDQLRESFQNALRAAGAGRAVTTRKTAAEPRRRAARA